MRPINRRDLGSLAAGLAAVGVAGGAAAKARSEISHTNAAIHQEILFKASAARVYQALTVAEQFDKVVQHSGAMNSSMKTSLGKAPTAIDAQSGGAFVLFGGYVTGRNIELVPNTRIVQAWRSGSWDAGLYSIAHFSLEDRGAATQLIFDHTGFPNAAAAHLADGWHENYWQPLAKVLAGN
jgi:activator of HSP90 ATPase